MDNIILEGVGILYDTKWLHVRLLLFTKSLQARGSIITIYFILCVEVLRKLIINNKEIRGIQINETDFKLSQYAEDPQIF